MVTQPRLRRAKGVAFESAVVAKVQACGLMARRLPEGGPDDQGDVEVWLPDGRRVVVECKHTDALSVHRVMAKTLRKAARGRHPASASAVCWKRGRKTGDSGRSVTVEPGPVVVMALDEWIGLLAGQSSAHEE